MTTGAGRDIKLVMMATGDFAVPTLQALIGGGYRLELLVSQPDRPRGRGRKLTPPQVKRIAVAHGLPVYQPNDVNAADSVGRLQSLAPELFIVAAYGQILSRPLLAVPRLGGINLHASLLPKYRGAAPVNWAIYHGETVTGVTVIELSRRVDAGHVLLQQQARIGPEETAGELEARLAQLGAPLVCQAIDGLAAGSLRGRPQDPTQVSRAPRLKKEHGLIDWSRPAAAVCNQVRAMQPWPTAYTYLKRSAVGAEPLRLIVERAMPCDLPLGGPARPAGKVSPPTAEASAAPGQVLGAERDLLAVQAGSGAVRIERLRPAGKRSMSAAEFLRGYPVRPGDQLGAAQ